MEDYVAPITEAAFEAPTIEPIHNDILDGVPTVQDMTKEASSEFGLRQGLVLGGLAVGGACTIYTGYKVFVDKKGPVRSKLIPWVKGIFAKQNADQPVQSDDGLVDDVNDAIVDEDE